MAASPSRLDRATYATALDALLLWVQSQQKHKKAQLLEHDEPIQVLISLRKIPAKPHINPHLIPLPHPPTHSSICLLVDDRPYSKSIPLDAIESKVKSDGLPISKVIPLQSLRTDYVPFESRRKLCGSYDLFFADRRILPLLPRLLGKEFFKKKKLPLKIDLSHDNWLPQIQRGYGAAFLYIRTGTCCHLNVGSVSMAKEDILENLAAAVDGVVQYVPKGWGNVRAVYLKLEESVALPIYQALPDIGMKIEVLLKDIEGVERIEGKDAEGKEVRKKTQKKKGTISEVRYMDKNLDHETIGDSGEESEGDVVEDAVAEVKVMDVKKKRRRRRNEGVDEDGEHVVSKKSTKKKKKKNSEEGSKGVLDDVVEAEGVDGKRKRKVGEDAEEIVCDADGEGVGKKTKSKSKKEKIQRVKNRVEDLKGSVGIGDHGGKNMVKNTRKKKEADDVKKDEAAVEVVDVLEVARVGVVERKSESKSVYRSKEQKKSKKKKTNC